MIGQTSSDSQGVQASGNTGALCQRSGPYQCNSHVDFVLIFKRGDRFSSCPVNNDEASKTAAGHATTWSMVKEG